MNSEAKRQITFQGTGASRGLAVGTVQLLGSVENSISRTRIDESDIPAEIVRLQDALLATRKQLREIRQHVGETIDENAATIFDTHLMMIDDLSFIDKIVEGLRKRKINLEHVIRDVLRQYAKKFSGMQGAYMQERGADIKDLMNRILQNLSEDDLPAEFQHPEGVVIVADDLLPSVTAQLDKKKILGIVTELGGQTSHAAIIARALEIPAVVGLEGLCESVQTGDQILIDGTQGRVILNPSSDQRTQYGHLEHMRADLLEGLKKNKHLEITTQAGTPFRVCANLELPEHLDRVLDSGADGIGLFRTEFLFLSRPDLPSEDEQAAAYEAVAEAMQPAKVVIRTMDIGGDKFLSHLHLKEQSRSALGCRGIRLSLARPDVFKVQLRAILRAAQAGNIRLMYPMVSSVDEIHQADQLLQSAAAELKAEGVPHNPEVVSGIMIETPSAALTADVMATHTRFFSLGTNDLVQYTLAVDRLEREVASLYDPLHAGVLKLIQQSVRSARENNITASVCGEMAGSPLMLPLLMGLGIEEVSVAPGSVPLIKHLASLLAFDEVMSLASWALTASDSKSVLEASRELLEMKAPDLKELFTY
ncbi:phosphoenolpyruvate--protein phosphotransferase [Kiritimatiellaeota bacterium B1221]|nr:phosphoenolpyruvate--protein phosphotransferase [Kiritimatiellaeota bacterium B1221]